MKSESFHLISMGRSFQRKMQRQGNRTRCEITGTPVHGYGCIIHYWKA